MESIAQQRRRDEGAPHEAGREGIWGSRRVKALAVVILAWAMLLTMGQWGSRS